MKITTEQELQPFSVPNYILAVAKARPRQEGILEVPKYHISELSDDVLESLCKKFRDDVFYKARQNKDWTDSPDAASLRTPPEDK